MTTQMRVSSTWTPTPLVREGMFQARFVLMLVVWVVLAVTMMSMMSMGSG
jgi:hypothetical protein